MIRLRSVTVLVAVLATAASGVAAWPAAAADQAAACDPALPAGLTWSVPSALAWGREARIGANVLDTVGGAAYQDDSVVVGVDGGKVHAAPDPVDHDLEFVVRAPASGTTVAAGATWLLTDDTASTHCAQSAALSIPIDSGKILRYSAARKHNDITWTPVGAGNCHDAAIDAISLTLRQGGMTRHLTAPDQCHPSGNQHVSTRDWELSVGDGAFRLTPLKAHSSLRARMRYVLRVGSRRVASGSLELVRRYRPSKLIRYGHDASFWDVCIHGVHQRMISTATTMGCIVAGSLTVRLTFA
jgi:hypothetical protein